jgi:crotonyl-CoA reductase
VNVGEAAYQVHKNLHEGKIGVLCLAEGEGQGIDDPEFRAKVGEDKITMFQTHGA